MANTISNTDDVIDSRDVIARIEELETEQAELVEQLSNGEITEADMLVFDKEQGKELDVLRKLAEEAESSPDWIHGEVLIHEDYFTTHIEELINDCYELPKEMNSGKWPYRHITFDYEAAAEDAKADYMEVDFDGNTYLIRA